MSDIVVQVNTKRVEKAMIALPRVLKEEAIDAFDHIGRKFYKTLWKNTELKTRPNVGIGKYSHYTVFGQKKRNPRYVGLSIYTYSEIAKAHEEGATVTGDLAVPIGEALSGTGRKKKMYKKPLSEIKGLFPLDMHGKRYLAKTTNKKTSILFVLKRSVKLKPRLKFMATWQELTGFRNEQINRAVDKTLKKVEAM